MCWLARLLGATPKEELSGIRLDTTRAFWELDGETDFPRLLGELRCLLPDGSILYFEDGWPDKELLEFFDAHGVAEQSHVAVGTLWPRPSYYHVPATNQNLSTLATLAESRAAPELAIHFHVYREGRILLEWHDVFSQPMLLSDELPEHNVRMFAAALSMTLNKRPGVADSACQ